MEDLIDRMRCSAAVLGYDGEARAMMHEVYVINGGVEEEDFFLAWFASIQLDAHLF